MTAMQQIEHISVEARKRGMKYGEYVEKYGHTLPKPKPKKKRNSGNIEGKGQGKGWSGHRAPVECVCVMCGETFMAGRKDTKYCPECRLKRAAESTKRCNEKKKGKSENGQRN